jgi:hypothetical protein
LRHRDTEDFRKGSAVVQQVDAADALVACAVTVLAAEGYAVELR